MTRKKFVKLTTVPLFLFICFFISPILSAQQLPNGGVLSGEIAVPNEIDDYTFTGTAGDVVLIRVADNAGDVDVSFDPLVQLIDPSFEVISFGRSGVTGGLVAEIAVRLIESGPYIVRVMDDGPFDGANVGTYDIYFASIPGANDDGDLESGTVVSDRIDRGDIDSYIFNARAGEVIFVRVSDTETLEFPNARFTPTVIVYGPDGSFVASENSGIRGGMVARVATQVVEDGDYTVIVLDGSGTGNDGSGNYNLYFAKVPFSLDADAVELDVDDNISDQIELGEIDTYRFIANAGDTVFLRLADTETTEFVNSSFTPFVALYSPSGDFVASGGSSTTGGLVAAIEERLTEAGVYSVVVLDASSSGALTGTYDLHFARTPGANEGGGIGDGDVIADTISLGDLDTFAFFAEPGTLVTVTMTEVGTDADFNPGFTVISPTGSSIVAANDATSAVASFVTAESGVHTLVLRDLPRLGEADGSGNYTVRLVGSGIVGVSVAECNGQTVTVDIGNGDTPTSGPDVILGTAGDDVISGQGGDDTICGLDGNDTINAGNGNDWVDAGPGIDTVLGGNGNDEIYGDSGVDIINGGPGDDELYGEAGGDFINGNSGDDLLDGGFGVDQLRGGSGNDVIDTGSGGNLGSGLVVTGGAGNDVMTGGSGADEIRGETGNDTILGGDASDSLFGGGGNDVVNGQDGNDLLRGNGSRDTVIGGDGNDDMDGGDSDDVMSGGNGNDVMRGATGNDEMSGGAGDDVMSGGGGSDVINGNRGEDELSGGGSNDTLNGGSDMDSCDGNGGIDTAVSCESQSNIP